MAQKTSRQKVNIPICAACVLFCLTLISIHLTSGLYARYVSADEAQDSARVVTFGDLSLTEDQTYFNTYNTWMIIPGVDIPKKATVDFAGSEAATYVFVEVVLSEHWASQDNKTFRVGSAMTFAIADGWSFLEEADGTWVFYRALAPNTALSADIIANNGTITVSDRLTAQETAALTGITIDFRATAVQSGGFEDPADAWASVS